MRVRFFFPCNSFEKCLSSYGGCCLKRKAPSVRTLKPTQPNFIVQEIAGDFFALTPVKQKGGKIVYAWAVAGDIDAATIVSNTYAVQWPKGTWRRYPEIDRAGWFGVEEARQKLLAAQATFIERLLAQLDSGEEA